MFKRDEIMKFKSFTFDKEEFEELVGGDVSAMSKQVFFAIEIADA